MRSDQSQSTSGTWPCKAPQRILRCASVLDPMNISNLPPGAYLNLVVVVFAAVILIYSLIIGRNQVLKILLSVYVAILTADGINVFLDGEPVIGLLRQFLQIADMQQFMLIVKPLIFIIVIIFISRGRFQVAVDEESNQYVSLGFNIAFSVLTAFLIVSTLLVYLSGGSFLGIPSPTITGGASAIASMKKDSQLIYWLVELKSLLISLPAILFVIMSRKSK